MAYVNPVEPYIRANYPQLPGSREKYLLEELKKLERVLASVVAALEEAEKRLTAGGL